MTVLGLWALTFHCAFAVRPPAPAPLDGIDGAQAYQVLSDARTEMPPCERDHRHARRQVCLFLRSFVIPFVCYSVRSFVRASTAPSIHRYDNATGKV